MIYFSIIRKLDRYHVYWYTDRGVVCYDVGRCSLKRLQKMCAKKRWRNTCNSIFSGVIKL